MGHLDETKFEQLISGCSKCDRRAFEVWSYIDRQVTVMLAESNNDGRWTHDGEKFIDGVYKIRCIGCGDEPFSTQDCPRCHRAGVLAEALVAPSRVVVPKRCPECTATEMLVTSFAPGSVRTGESRPPSPTPVALYGDPGYHIEVVMCDGCEWVVACEGCPICGGPGPLRTRPG